MCHFYPSIRSSPQQAQTHYYKRIYPTGNNYIHKARSEFTHGLILYISGIKLENKDMTSVKLKFRPSTSPNREGSLIFQLIHDRTLRRIKSTYKIFSNEWDEAAGQILLPPPSSLRSTACSAWQRCGPPKTLPATSTMLSAASPRH